MKRKIQNALVFPSFINIIVISFFLISFLSLILIPVTAYLTKSATSRLIGVHHSLIGVESKYKEIDIYNILSMDKESIRDSILANNEKEESEFEVTFENFTLDTDIVVADENEIKLLMVSVQRTYKELNEFFTKYIPNTNLYYMDYQVNDLRFVLPQDLVMQTQENTSNLFSSLNVIDKTGEMIGRINIGINRKIFDIFFIILITIGLLIGLISLFVIFIFSRIITKSLLKPINVTISQLEMMSEEDVDNLKKYHLNVKKPPIEVEKLITYSNNLIDKVIENTKSLEEKNCELVAQNDELIKNRQIIESQQTALVQTEKMATIGQISAAIVHEINTPVGAIKSNSQLIEFLIENMNDSNYEKNRDKIIELNDIVVDASDRVIEIVRSLKNFSRLDQSYFRDSNIVEGMDSVLVLTSNLWKNKVKINKSYEAIGLVKCYPSLLNQVFMNVIVNAIDAIGEEGVIEIKIFSLGNNAVVRICDNGEGMENVILDKVFDQGFTTKDIGKGSGLGLTISKQIVIKHNGSIEIESTKGKGTCATVKIPFEPGIIV
jgi:signal transduction histidine kinase